MEVVRRNGFTLLELLVVVVIVGVLAAAAVPIYLNYVKDSRRAEAKGGLGAVQTAEQAYFQKNGAYKDGADNAALTTNINVDLSDPGQNWAFKVTGASATGYTADAKGKSGTPAAGLEVQLVYSTTSGILVADIS